jgi:hypothetical protein
VLLIQPGIGTKTGKSGQNGRKVKAIALLFFFFLATYEKWKKTIYLFMKNGKSGFFSFFPLYEKWKMSLKMDEK